MGKYTKADVMALAQYMRREREQSRPVAFLTGAGCSLQADIPLATGLVARFKAEIRPDLPDDYGQCMAQLTKEERKDVLNPILLASKVNWANIALAGLLKAGWIGRILTFNFDNVLVRACGLDGYYPPVYDFGVSPAETFDHIVPGSILHLHGQGSGLAMMNSTDETREHAKKLKPLFENTMDHMGLVVLGYSGGSDAAFAGISECAKNNHRLWWCSHGDDPDTHVKDLVAKYATHHHLGGVDADVFLIELARELDCFPPILFTQHEQHLLDELVPVVEFPPEAGGGTSILVDLRTRLQQAIASKPEKTDFNQLLLEGKWDELVGLEASATSDSEKEAVAWAYTMQGVALAGQARATSNPDLFADAGEKYAAALVLKPDKHEALNNWGSALAGQARATNNPALFEKAGKKYAAALVFKLDFHEALYNWGNALAGQAEATNNPALFDEAGEKYAAALALKPDKHEALYNWGNALADQAEATNNPALFDRAGEKYAAALAIKPDDHEALTNWGIALDDQARATNTPALFDKAGEKFAAALALKPDDHKALINWGSALAGQARATNTPALFDKAGEKFAAALVLKPDLHKALYSWGNALADQAEATKNPALFEKAGEKYAAALAIKPEYGSASYNLACMFLLTDRPGEARAQLEKSLASGTLPPADEIEADADLASLRDLPWFRDLIAARRAREKAKP